MGFFSKIGQAVSKGAKWAMGQTEQTADTAKVSAEAHSAVTEPKRAKAEQANTHRLEKILETVISDLEELASRCETAIEELEEKNGELAAQIETVQEALMQELESCNEKLEALQATQEEYRHEMNGKLIFTGVLLGVGLFITLIIAVVV